MSARAAVSDPHIHLAAQARALPHMCDDEACPGRLARLQQIQCDLLLTSLQELAGDMEVMFARADPRGFLERALGRSTAIVSWCMGCGCVFGIRDSNGAPGGLSDGFCTPACLAQWRRTIGEAS